MREPFASGRTAASFAVLLAILLSLPLFAFYCGWVDPARLYPTISWRFGSFPWIQQKIYSERSPVDIAFVGPSMLWCDIDAHYVEEALSQRLGRRANVFALGWNTAGFDATYFVARDLLEHRQCRVLVTYDDQYGLNSPQRMVYKRYCVGEDSEVLAGLSWKARGAMYGGAVLGLPRQLLSVLRTDGQEGPVEWRNNPNFTAYGAEDLPPRNGSLRVHWSYGNNPEFSALAIHSAARPSGALVWSQANRLAFRLGKNPLLPYQLCYAKKLAELCARHHTRLVIVHLPEFKDRRAATIESPSIWPLVLSGDVRYVGFPEATLFAGMKDEEVQQLFYNNRHFNLNGQDFFAPLITPLLLNIYEKPAAR